MVKKSKKAVTPTPTPHILQKQLAEVTGDVSTVAAQQGSEKTCQPTETAATPQVQEPEQATPSTVTTPSQEPTSTAPPNTTPHATAPTMINPFDVGAIRAASRANARRISSDNVEAATAAISELTKKFVQFLDPDGDEFVLETEDGTLYNEEAITVQEGVVVKTIYAAPTPSTKSAIVLAFLGAMESAPRVPNTGDHLLDILHKAGVIRNASRQEVDFFTPGGPMTLVLTHNRNTILAKIKAILGEIRHAETKKLATGDPEQALKSGGVTTLVIPDETFWWDEENKKRVLEGTPGAEERIERGGKLEIRVDHGEITPLKAIGHHRFEEKVAKLVENGVFVPVWSVDKENLPRPSDERIRNTFGLARRLHSYVRRGLAHYSKEKKLKARETADQFGFVLRDEIGAARLELHSTRQGRDRSPAWTWRYKEVEGDTAEEKVVNFENLAFFTERNTAGEIRVVREYLEDDEQLRKLFAGCFDFKAPGERFQDLNSPLREILRKLHYVFAGIEMRGRDGGRQETPNRDSEPEPRKVEVEF